MPFCCFSATFCLSFALRSPWKQGSAQWAEMERKSKETEVGWTVFFLLFVALRCRLPQQLPKAGFMAAVSHLSAEISSHAEWRIAGTLQSQAGMHLYKKANSVSPRDNDCLKLSLTIPEPTDEESRLAALDSVTLYYSYVEASSWGHLLPALIRRVYSQNL